MPELREQLERAEEARPRPGPAARAIEEDDDLAERVLGGEITGGQVLCPGPGHSRADRSLAIRLATATPNGIIVYSHAGDDWRVCRAYVLGRLGIAPERDRGARPLLAGGSGLYYRAVVDQLDFPPTDPSVRARIDERSVDVLWKELRESDPEAAKRIDPQNKRRIVRALEVFRATGRPISEHHRSEPEPLRGFEVRIVALSPPRETLRAAIERLEARERTDEGMELILKAWTEPYPFAWQGRHFQYRMVSIWPKPLQRPHPPTYALGTNLTVVAQSLPGEWWQVPVLVLSAVENAVLEEYVVLGFVLGKLAETYLFISMARYGYGWLTQPLVLVLGALTALVIVYPYIQERRTRAR